MSASRRAEICQHSSLLKHGNFNVDEAVYTYERQDGTMSPEQRRLVFERGDTAAVLLLNAENDSVVLVNQFRVPTLLARRRDNRSTTNGWLNEAIAGMIDSGESAEQTIVRETKEETGYEIRDPKLICQFFASPGGTSERISVFFAQVSGTRSGKGGGVGDEDVTVVELPVIDLFEMLAKGQIEDPKLLIGAYWLQQYLRAPLGPSTVKFRFKDKPNLVIGYKAGTVDHVKNVDIWVNSENTDMMMDRFIGRSVSARIRYLGANKNRQTIIQDTIQDALKSAVGEQGYVKIGTVLVTQSGMLLSSHQVERIFHVASVEGRPGTGIQADPGDLETCVQEVLQRVDEENKPRWPFSRKNLDSILFPMLGAGDGGLPITEVADKIIPATINYLQTAPNPTLTEVYFLVFRPLDKSACERVLRRYCANGTLARLG